MVQNYRSIFLLQKRENYIFCTSISTEFEKSNLSAIDRICFYRLTFFKFNFALQKNTIFFIFCGLLQNTKIGPNEKNQTRPKIQIFVVKLNI